MLKSYKEYARIRGLLENTPTGPGPDLDAIIGQLEQLAQTLDAEIDKQFALLHGQLTGHVRLSMRNNQGLWSRLKTWWQTVWHGNDRDAVESVDGDNIRLELPGLLSLYEHEILTELMQIMEAGPINQAIAQIGPMLDQLRSNIKLLVLQNITNLARQLRVYQSSIGNTPPEAPGGPQAPPEAPGGPGTPPPGEPPAGVPGTSASAGTPSSSPAGAPARGDLLGTLAAHGDIDKPEEPAAQEPPSSAGMAPPKSKKRAEKEKASEEPPVTPSPEDLKQSDLETPPDNVGSVEEPPVPGEEKGGKEPASSPPEDEAKPKPSGEDIDLSKLSPIERMRLRKKRDRESGKGLMGSPIRSRNNDLNYHGGESDVKVQKPTVVTDPEEDEDGIPQDDTGASLTPDMPGWAQYKKKYQALIDSIPNPGVKHLGEFYTKNGPGRVNDRNKFYNFLAALQEKNPKGGQILKNPHLANAFKIMSAHINDPGVFLALGQELGPGDLEYNMYSNNKEGKQEREAFLANLDQYLKDYNLHNKVDYSKNPKLRFINVDKDQSPKVESLGDMKWRYLRKYRESEGLLNSRPKKLWDTNRLTLREHLNLLKKRLGE